MVQISLEQMSFRSSENSQPLQNEKVYYHFYKNPLFDPVLSQFESFPIITRI